MKILKDWYTFSHASKLIGKNRNYFVNRYRINPDIFKEECLLEVDGIKFINKEGIEFLQQHIKKVAVLINNAVFIED